jgi:hypothetical protein
MPKMSKVPKMPKIEDSLRSIILKIENDSPPPAD